MNLQDEFRVFTSPLPSVRGSETQWAGAERPKAEVDDSGRRDAPQAPPNAKVRAYTYRGSKSIDLKLREQAARHGLQPGSPRWRAYVLGTKAAAAKKRRKRKVTGGEAK
jgi:hypothetical protein